MEVQHEAPHGDLNCSDQLQGLVHRKGPMGSRTAVVGFRPPGAPSTPWRTQPQWSASGPRPHKAPLGDSNRSGRLQALGHPAWELRTGGGRWRCSMKHPMGI